MPTPCETPLLVDATAHCGGVTDPSARRRSKNTSAGDVLGDSVCGKPDHVLSPYELVNQKTEEVKRIMDEKRTLIADILQIPLYDCNTIPEVVDEVNDSSDPRELLFASITPVSYTHLRAHETGRISAINVLFSSMIRFTSSVFWFTSS